MKKHLIVLLAVLICFLSACQGVPVENPKQGEGEQSPTVPTPEPEPEPDLKNELLPLTLEERYNCIYDGDRVFYVRENTVFSRAEQQETALFSGDLFADAKQVQLIQVWNENVYFLVWTQYYAENSIWRCPISGGTPYEFVETNLSRDEIVECFYHENAIYVTASMGFYCLDLVTETFEKLPCDVEVSGSEIFDFIGNDLYYADCLVKTFSIYRYNREMTEPELVLGDGFRNPDATQYRDVACIGDTLFVHQMFPDGISSYDFEKKELICSYEGEWAFAANSLFSFRECLYYILKNTDGIYELKQYNPQTKETSVVCELKGFDRFSGVRNGILCYRTEDEACYLDLNAF